MRKSLVVIGCWVLGFAVGCSGDDGQRGPAGAPGDPGEQGEKGETGDQGAPGDKGDTGEPGETGEQGETGAQGETGETGAQGETGLDFVRTVVVSPVGPSGTAQENGTRLLAALDGIVTADYDDPVLLKLEPGRYDLGDKALFMKSWLDIEGSGEGITTISSTATNTVLAASSSELRFLSINNSGAGTFQGGVGVYANVVEFRLTNVTITATGSGSFVNAVSGHADIRNCTLTATGTNGALSRALFDNGNALTTIVGSRLSGTTNSILLQSGIAKLANTELHGPAEDDGLRCTGCYDVDFGPLDSSCQPPP